MHGASDKGQWHGNALCPTAAMSDADRAVSAGLMRMTMVVLGHCSQRVWDPAFQCLW